MKLNWPCSRFFAFMRACGLVLIFGLTFTVFPASAVRASGTYTVYGKVLYPDGRPAPAMAVELIAWSSYGWDKQNLVYKIPNYDKHPVVTDASGNFVMTGVNDYAQNPTHRYILHAEGGPGRLWYGSLNFGLIAEDHKIHATVHLEEMTLLRIKLKDAKGRPYQGTRAIFVQTGPRIDDGSVGFGYIAQVNFVNGVGQIPVVIRDKHTQRGRVAILPFPSIVAAKKTLMDHGMKTGDTSTDPLKFATHDARGRALDQQLKYNAQSATEVSFSL